MTALRAPIGLALLALGAAAQAQSARPDRSAAADLPPMAAKLSAVLAGKAEVPPGDEDGSGSFKAWLNDTHDQLCYELKVDRIEQATAAHIHAGAAGRNGAPVVTLDPPANGVANGCATVTAELAIKLTQHPENYYVNVHNAAHPGGAVRGQLER